MTAAMAPVLLMFLMSMPMATPTMAIRIQAAHGRRSRIRRAAMVRRAMMRRAVGGAVMRAVAAMRLVLLMLLFFPAAC